MATIDIPGIKRAGLPVDLNRLTVDGDEWLSAEERYALKMHGVCAQAQPNVFMIRCRTHGGKLSSHMVRGLAAIADYYAEGWVHLTTRQQVELHNVAARDVTAVLAEIREAGLDTNSTCGHTMRGVMSCPQAGVGLDEPFDCHPDAVMVSESILARTPELNTRMPQRINILFGGCVECRDHAKINDAGFISKIGEDHELGYELLVGGSLGKSSPRLAITAVDFLRRSEVLPAVNALFDVFVEHGDFDQPGKARLKFLVAKLGPQRFLELFNEAFESAKHRPWPAPAPLSLPLSSSMSEILSCAPEGGWSSGIRPQRVPGQAMVTVNIPLGDIYGDELRVLADIADDFGDHHIYPTKNQNAMLRYVAIEAIPTVRAGLASVGLHVEGADQARDIRACTGGPVCALAITPAQGLAARLLDHRALERNSGLRISVSGCPNACAQHQIADLGFSGGMVTIAGRQTLGYQVWLGGDLRNDIIGTVVGRVAEADVPAIAEAIIGAWEALREPGEKLSDTVVRFGLDAVKAQIGAIFKGRWEPGPEPAMALVGSVQREMDLRLPMVGSAS